MLYGISQQQLTQKFNSKVKTILLNILLLFLFTSCNFGVHKTVYQSQLSNAFGFKIKNKPLDCGCKLLYVDSYVDRRLTEQIAVEFVCDLLQPTKFIFSYDANGKIISFKKFRSVTDSTYKIALTKNDKIIFHKLDSLSQKWNSDKVRLNLITGFVELEKSTQTAFSPVGFEKRFD